MDAVSVTTVPPQLKVTVSGSQSPPFCGLTKCHVPVPLHLSPSPLVNSAASAAVTKSVFIVFVDTCTSW